MLVASGGFLVFGGSRVHADPIKSEHTVSAPPRAGDGSPSEVTSEQKLDEASESKQAQAIAQPAVENSSEVANSSTNASSTHSRQKRSLDSVGQDRDINGGLIDKGDLVKNVTSLNEPGDKHAATDYHYYTNYDNEPAFGLI